MTTTDPTTPAVVVSPAAAPTPALTPGTLILSPGGNPGIVVPAPASIADTWTDPDEWAATLDPANAGRFVWARMRSQGRPVTWGTGEIEAVDVDTLTEQLLALLAAAGIAVERAHRGLTDDFSDHGIAADDVNARAVITLRFPEEHGALMSDALDDLAGFGAYEFGARWPRAHAGEDRDAPVTAVHLTDVPLLMDLLEREIAGELDPTPSQRRRFKALDYGQAAAVFAMILMVGGHIISRHAFGPLSLIAFVVLGIAAGLCERSKRANPTSWRSSLVAARRVTRGRSS
jgi:hypothetical protein